MQNSVYILVSLPFFCLAAFYLFDTFKKKQIAEKTVIDLKDFIQNIPFPWCCWYIGDEKAIASEKFFELLGITKTNLLDLQIIYKIFGNSSLSQFQRALNHIYSFGGKFSIQTSFESQTDKEFMIHGTLVEKNSKNQKEKKLVIITLQDITLTSIDLRKQQNYLKETEQELLILRQYVENSSSFLWFKNNEDKIIHCNKAYSEAINTPIEKIISENLYIFKNRDLSTNNNHKKRFHSVIKGQRKLIEAREIKTSLGTVGIAKDITDIENWESEMQRHIQAQREILENLSNPIAIYDSETNLQYFNTAYLKTFQFQESFLYSKPKFSDVLEDLRKRRKMIDVEDFKKHKQNRIGLFNTVFEPLHEIHYQPDGTVLKMTVCPHVLGGLLFIFEDISDKLSLERGYNTLLAVQKETIDNLYEGLVVIGTDLRLRLSNKACEKLLKLNDESRKNGTHLVDFIEFLKPILSEKTFHFWKDYVYELLENRIPSKEIIDILPEGKIQISYIPLPDGSHLLSFVDIYDRWKFEQSIKDRNEVLEQADRLKTNFISHVSYELRSPLSTIAGFVDILKNQYFGALNERQMDYCQGIQDSNQKLMQLINDMMDLANIEAGKLSLNYNDIVLNNFLESCVALVKNRAFDQGVDINIINNSKISVFQADEKRLKHVLFNLLANSLKFTLPGGQVSVIGFDVEEDEDMLGICVNDTGIGIKPEDQEKIFDIFEHGSKTKINKKGAGLGLPLVKRLVELHNGKVFIVSQANEGTKIIIHIPIKNKQLKPLI